MYGANAYGSVAYTGEGEGNMISDAIMMPMVTSEFINSNINDSIMMSLTVQEATKTKISDSIVLSFVPSELAVANFAWIKNETAPGAWTKRV